MVITLTWVSVKSLDLTLKRTLSSFSRGPTLHLRTVQRFASHPSSSASNSASDLFLLDSTSKLARDLCTCSRIYCRVETKFSPKILVETFAKFNKCWLYVFIKRQNLSATYEIKRPVCENILISRDFDRVSRNYLFSRTYSMRTTGAGTGRSGKKFPIFAKFW